MSIAFNSVGNGITNQSPDVPDLAEAPAAQGPDGFLAFSEILVSSLRSSVVGTAEFDVESEKLTEASADWRNLPPDAAVIAANFAVLANFNANLSRAAEVESATEGAPQSVALASIGAGAASELASLQQGAALRQTEYSGVTSAVGDAWTTRLQTESREAFVADDARTPPSSIGGMVDAASSGALPGPVAFTAGMAPTLDKSTSVDALRIGEPRAGTLLAERQLPTSAASATTQGGSAPAADVTDVAGIALSKPERDAGAGMRDGTPALREMRHVGRQSVGESQVPATAADAAESAEQAGVLEFAQMVSRQPVELEPRKGSHGEVATHAGVRVGSELSAAFAGLLNAREAVPQSAPTEATPSASALSTAPPMAMDVEVLRLAANGGGRAVMELNPDSAGSMHIDLTLDGLGQARLIVEAPADASRARLEQDVQRLQNDFASLGLTLSVDVRDQREAPRQGMQGQQPGGLAAPQEARGAAIDITPAVLSAQAAAAGRVHIYA